MQADAARLGGEYREAEERNRRVHLLALLPYRPLRIAQVLRRQGWDRHCLAPYAGPSRLRAVVRPILFGEHGAPSEPRRSFGGRRFSNG